MKTKPDIIEVQAGSDQNNYPPLVIERRVDTVVIRQGNREISLDEWYVKGLREALYALAPRDIGPVDWTREDTITIQAEYDANPAQYPTEDEIESGQS